MPKDTWDSRWNRFPSWCWCWLKQNSSKYTHTHARWASEQARQRKWMRDVERKISNKREFQMRDFYRKKNDRKKFIRIGGKLHAFLWYLIYFFGLAFPNNFSLIFGGDIIFRCFFYLLLPPSFTSLIHSLTHSNSHWTHKFYTSEI